ncbi:hypothetical protein ACLG6S_13695 [Thermodesulfobacteriota bacterium B35]
MTIFDAYKIAIDTRNLEIKLFWQRSLFFGAFISITFAGYANQKIDDETIKMVLLSFGVIFSLAWCLANRGSKYWYESWETKIEQIEQHMPTNLISEWIKPQKKFPLYQGRLYSVSKIAIFISDLILLGWVFLFFQQYSKMTDKLPDIFWLFIIIQIALLLFGTRTNVPRKTKDLWKQSS